MQKSAFKIQHDTGGALSCDDWLGGGVGTSHLRGL